MTHRDFCAPTPFLPYNSALLDAEANRSASQGSSQQISGSRTASATTARPFTSPAVSNFKASENCSTRIGVSAPVHVPHPEGSLDPITSPQAEANALASSAAPRTLKDPLPHCGAERPATSSSASRGTPASQASAGPRPVTAPSQSHLHQICSREHTCLPQPPLPTPPDTGSPPADVDATASHSKEGRSHSAVFDCPPPPDANHTAAPVTPRPPLESPRHRYSGAGPEPMGRAASGGRRPSGGHQRGPTCTLPSKLEGVADVVPAPWEWGRTRVAPGGTAYSQDFSGGPLLLKATHEAAALLMQQVGAPTCPRGPCLPMLALILSPMAPFMAAGCHEWLR